MNSNALAVWRDGRVENECCGKRVGARMPLLSKTLSKLLDATAVLRAISLGKIHCCVG